jgi:hypothetical protein
MKSKNASKTEYTIGIGRLNLIAIFVNISVTIIFILAFKYVWGMDVFYAGKSLLMEYWLETILAGFIAHELLHGFIYAYFAEEGIRSIGVGFKWRWLTPYCHCNEPLSVRNYRISGVMPFLILGIIPSFLAILIGSGSLICLGLFFTWFGVGDVIVLFVLKNLDDDSVVSVHPSKVGFIREMGTEMFEEYKSRVIS